MPNLDDASIELITAADLAATDHLYVRRTGAVAGLKDAKMALSAMFRSFLGLTIAAGKLPYGSAANTFSLTDLTAFGRALLDDATAPLARVTLGIITNTATLNFGSINAAASADLTITVTGASEGDAVMIGLPAAPAAGIVFFGFASATDTITIRAMNITGSPVDPASAVYRAIVVKSA